MIADIHMSPDVYEEWQAMSREEQDFALDAVERAILEAMEELQTRIEAEYAATSSLSPAEPPSPSFGTLEKKVD